MSFGALATRPPLSNGTSSEAKRGRSRKSLSSSLSKQLPAPPASEPFRLDLASDVDGLGITALPQAYHPDPRTAPRSKSPLLEIQDLKLNSDAKYLSPQGYFSDPATGDSSSDSQKSLSTRDAESENTSVTSSLRDARSSVESLGTTVSTAPTTPGTRGSTSSRFSLPLSRDSRADFTPSTTSSDSRSPSPPKDVSTHREVATAPTTPEENVNEKKKGFPRPKILLRPSSSHSSEAEKPQSPEGKTVTRRRSRMLLRKSSKSLNRTSTESSNEAEDGVPSSPSRRLVPPMPTSFSSSKLSTLVSPNLLSPIPMSPPMDRMNAGGLTIPKKKDELWSVFRNLDADYSKFQSKSITLKSNVVRTALLPFLRTYATHSSNRNLRLEDLDRRANILNKWWLGLIDLLHGQNNQSISGTDRPIILDGISGIMERPEWRPAPSSFCPIDQRIQRVPSPKNHSNTSVISDASDFISDSIYHNVRNIFVQNLTAQMAFVIEKMSLRHAPASLVAFCGKACAYAFMFVPCMADVLVRLWEISTESLQRILKDYDIGKYDDMSSVTGRYIAGFPPALQQSGLTSLMKYMRKLRTAPQLPAGTTEIQWWGPWLERWRGRDSDLFYGFVKHFHILTTDFLPPGLSKTERICAPGLLLVHCQILVNIDATVHRQANQSQHNAATSGASLTFDEILPDPDVAAPAIPVPPSNASRTMAENRLVMLARDFLSEQSTDHTPARQLYAEAFSGLLQTAVRGIGVFDHAASYTFLEFLEVAMVLLARFEVGQQIKSMGKSTLIDMDFWVDVWKKMMSSHNTLTEVRLYAFLYTIWPSVICETGWKSDVCADFLLDPEIFQSRFNHWCPTVRAYFMRLLCWRVARPDGNYSDVDVGVFEKLSDRLQNAWSQFLFLQKSAESQGKLPPPTNPCNPVPSRRLRIVRTDGHMDTNRAFLKLENMLTLDSDGKIDQAALKCDSALPTVDIDVQTVSSSSNEDADAEQRGRGGIGGFIRNLIGVSRSRSTSRTPSRSRSRHNTQRLSAVPGSERPVSTMRSASDGPSSTLSRSATPAFEDPPMIPMKDMSMTMKHRKLSFKFALEFHANTQPFPMMRLQAPVLPGAAQQFLFSHSHSNARLQSHEKLRRAARNGDAVAGAQQRVEAESRIVMTAEMRAQSKYCGHALAEWAVVLAECASFFERRMGDGVPLARFVETPVLGVEVFRRPG